ncbi:MAG TPA: efflux transporter outer membrane subunit [Caulobacteraceae bacterium]|jgi:multidrug efflux system outer membrane protein|nr:efflux transporter outer membrane subunit [Caulobacteraceae bacterium]
MRRRLALIALPALLAGCTLEPAYHRPPLPTPAVVANSYGAVQAAPAIQSWRAFFGDPRLTAVIGQALANNRDLPVAVANVQIARSNWIIQRAQLFPAVNAQLGATFSQTPASAIQGTAASGAYNEHIYSAGLGVTNYELDLFGRVRSLSKAALEQYFASKEARDAAQISLVGQVAQAWLTLGADRSLLAVASDTVTEAKASLDLTSAMFQHGEAAQSDVDQARTLVGQAEYDVGRYSTQVAQDKDALDLLAGTSIAEDLLPTGIDDEANILGDLPTGVSSEVLQARPDVLQAEAQLKAANANIGAARAAFFPQITLTGAGGVTSVALSGLFSAGAGTWSFVPQLTQPIFDAGKNRAGLSQAKAQRDSAQASYEKAIQTAFREVADALAQRARIDQELSAQQTMTDAAADAVRLTKAEFSRGSASYLNVLTAERTLFAAQQTLATTRLLRAANLVSLYQALGGGLS